MTTLGWNSRGVGPPATVQELACLVQTYKPCLVFICETRQSKERVENLCFRIGMKECFQIKGEGKGGGLALYWTEDITVDLLSFSITTLTCILVVALMNICGGAPSFTVNPKHAIVITCGLSFGRLKIDRICLG
jgi:hypothetical protein